MAVPSNSALLKGIGGDFGYFTIARELQAVEFDQGWSRKVDLEGQSWESLLYKVNILAVNSSKLN